MKINNYSYKILGVKLIFYVMIIILSIKMKNIDQKVKNFIYNSNVFLFLIHILKKEVYK